ncbi:phosphatidylserine/phosphatidylglycerophosphate/cardiolipin synthase family protein [Streptomyces sp. NPDC057877]|uniref:phospholipase D-like domain-containing protein n=1 Tax=Streptomyces sp. NPDC057877 TaxID=3346269 RepID=UPI0036AEB99E
MFLCAASLVLASLSAPPAAAATADCVEEGNYEVCFTYGGTTETLIARKIKAKIDATADAAQSGDYIRVALYEWVKDTDGYGTQVAQSLVRAAQNGVNVRVVLSSLGSNDAVVSYLEANNIDVHQCAKACNGPDGTMHNKIFLIKKGDTRLVLQSSSNFSLKQAQHAQNLLISRDDTALFTHYVDYWNRMRAANDATKTYWTHGGVTWDDDAKARAGDNDLSRAYFYPMETKSPLVGVLRNVTACAAGNDRVWLEASLFNPSDYSKAIAAELNRLVGIGCNVKVIVQKESGETELKAQGFPAARVFCHGEHHNKLTLIDAYYAGAWREAVFVGSYNVTENSLRNADDAMLRVINGWATARYVEQFQALWGADVGCDQTDDGSGSS